MNKAQIRTAKALCDMAAKWSAENGMGHTYTVREDAEPVKVGRRVYYPVTTHQYGQELDYFLAKDSGSWRGAWPQDL